MQSSPPEPWWFLCLEEKTLAKPSRLATGILGRKASQPIDRWYIWRNPYWTTRCFLECDIDSWFLSFLIIPCSLGVEFDESGNHFQIGKIDMLWLLCQVTSWFLQLRWIKYLQIQKHDVVTTRVMWWAGWVFAQPLKPASLKWCDRFMSQFRGIQ